MRQKVTTRGCSSAGRAPALQAGGQEFDPPHLHQVTLCNSYSYLENWITRRSDEDEIKASGNVYWYCPAISKDHEFKRKFWKENQTDQAKKSTGWMPCHQEPKKDVTSCDKLRVAANKRFNRRFPNWETTLPARVTIVSWIHSDTRGTAWTETSK